ncbi:lytic transglycosylase domain-containing protein [Candidatus Saccharibacteria bacterium]|nr:lytic transglycosylase domain-containing protein [Candidatus Saccharibacteria bacterium]
MKKILLLSTLLALFIDAVQYIAAPHTYFASRLTHPTGQTTLAAAAATPAVSMDPGPSTPPPPPVADPITPVAAKLSAAGLSPSYAGLYLSVQARTGTPWQLIAAVHKLETNQAGTTGRTSSAGAVGPFQFIPATWRVYALDGNADGSAQITNLDDAAMTAGHYLAVSGANRRSYSQALFNYNHSSSYVTRGMSLAYRLGL